MSTRSLLLLVAWIGGAELCVRGHLAANAAAFHAGAWLLATALWITTLHRPGAVRRGARALAALLALLSLAELLPRRTDPGKQGVVLGDRDEPSSKAGDGPARKLRR